MSGAPIRDGAIVFARGRVIAVGPADGLARLHPDATPVDRPNDTVLPGLVNAHVHLELSGLAAGTPPKSFADWLLRLIPTAAAPPENVEQSVTRSVSVGVEQCLRFGVTSVGDISRRCAISRRLLRDGPLRVVSYGEVQAMAQRRGLLEERLAVAADDSLASPFLRIAISPHAPYSVEPRGYRRCVEVARSRGLSVCTHLAESPDEEAFLANHSGPFRELWSRLGAWDENVPAFAGGPIRFAQHLGLLDSDRTLLAHVNYCDDSELNLLANGRAHVVYCPRTHAYFGHPPHRWREMLDRGINVAVGTDSCASSPDLNLVEDLRVLRRLAPDLPALRLWEMATVRAARAVGMEDDVGSLAPGKYADFALFAEAGEHPLESILDRGIRPSELWVGGVQNRLP